MRRLLWRRALASKRAFCDRLWCERRELSAVSSRMATTHVHRMESCIRGYHVYHRIRYPTVGERLNTIRERENMHDRYAVAVLEKEPSTIQRLIVVRGILKCLTAAATDSLLASVTTRFLCSMVYRSFVF